MHTHCPFARAVRGLIDGKGFPETEGLVGERSWQMNVWRRHDIPGVSETMRRRKTATYKLYSSVCGRSSSQTSDFYCLHNSE